MYLYELYRKNLFVQVHQREEVRFRNILRRCIFYDNILFMVRLINKKNIWIVKSAAKGYMKMQEPFTHIVEINQKFLEPAIYVMWHSDQFCVYGINDRTKVNVLVSTSLDGEIVAYAASSLGLKIIRGSSGKKGAVESSLKMLERLKEGEDIAIMVDGPSGPYHSVKNGAIKLAKMSGAPIVPVVWYSADKTFHTIPTWDKMTFPLFNAKIINLYGEPIYVPEDMQDEDLGKYKNIIKTSLEDLQAKAPNVYKEALKDGLWDKEKNLIKR